MRELRQKVLLQSGKTMSRKAQSRPESTRGSAVPSPRLSPHGSRPGSRPASRPVSRQVSEDEDEDYDSDDDIMTASASSISEEPGNLWTDRLRDVLTQLQERKRSSAEGRITTLKVYIHILRHHFAQSEIRSSTNNIVAALLKSISDGASEERLLAVTALTLTTLTSGSEQIFNLAYNRLVALVDDTSESIEQELKAEAITTMAVVVLYGGGGDHNSAELLQNLMDIVQTDGGSVNSENSVPVVEAALRIWGFVASHLEDISDYSEEALEMFADQLDSSDVDIQGAAGNNIGFLYEASREHEEETGETLVLPIDPKRLTMKLTELSRFGGKRISKKNRRTTKDNFASVVTSLELGKGPGWSTAVRSDYRSMRGIDEEFVDGRAEDHSGDSRYVYGYREKWRTGDIVVTLDSWSLKAQVDTFRAIFRGGVGVHLLENPVLEDILDVGERKGDDEE